MSARINLAPEVYQDSQRSKRRKKLATTIAVAVCSISGGLVVLGLIIIAGQTVFLSTLQKDISDRETKVESYSDLPDAVTAQQHLASLNDISAQKVHFSRFFSVLESLAPQGFAVSTISISNYNLLTMSASDTTYALVTTFAKALKTGRA